MTLDQQIEAILFWRGEPVAIKKLADLVRTTVDKVEEEIKVLEAKLTDRGLTLIYKNDEVALGTNPGASDLIEAITKEELSKDLGRAGLETLAIVLYRGAVPRAEIDYLRGVNSSFILRHLLVRGLIERIVNPADARGFLYRPSFDLLAHLGLRRLDELPDYQNIQQSLTANYRHD